MKNAKGIWYVIGNRKNAGKTTLANFMAGLARKNAVKIGRSTCGRDGEHFDAFTGEPKPLVTLEAGDIAVTYETELKRLGDAARNVYRLPYSTVLGRLFCIQALSIFSCEILGPDTNSELINTTNILISLGCDLVVIDGSFARRTQLATPGSPHVVLVIAADMGEEQAVADARFAAKVFDLPIATNELEHHDAVVFSSPLTDRLCLELIQSIHKRPLILQAPTSVFCSEQLFDQLRESSGGIYVNMPSILEFFATNPMKHSPDKILEAVAKAGNRPVIDVLYEKEVAP